MTVQKAGAAASGAQITEPFMVFLVEDDQDDRALMTKTLRQSPHIHEIRPYDSGDNLLFDLGREMYYSNSVIHTLPTVILLDMHMPGQGGMAALRQLKAHTLTSSIPVIVSTNDNSPETMGEAKRLGAAAYLQKPINLEELHKALTGAWAWPASLAN